MSTPPASTTTNSSLGSSRLLGTNDAQRAVDSLGRQISNLERAIAQSVSAFQSLSNSTNRTQSNSGASSRWNAQSNFPNNNGGRPTYAGGNGGGGNFGGANRLGGGSPNGGSGGGSFGGMLALGSGRGNGGGGGFGGSSSMGRFGLAGAAVMGAAKGLVNYGNRNMSSNMQMDMFGNYSALAGGIGPGGYQATNNVGMRTTFVNNRIALSANDAAQGGYTAAYTFGAPQFNGQTNSAYTQGVRQASGFAFASPTLGFAGAMTAAQQTYSARSLYATQMYGLTPAIGMSGNRATMGQIASSMMGRTFQGRTQVSNKTLDASLQQGGSLAVNLQSYGQAAGWNQSTIQSYENYIRGLNAAQNKGMTQGQYDKLTQTAATGSGSAKRNALDKLKSTTGLGASMFETQRDLNATRLNRQEDILESLAPAFENATKMVNRFSDALTKFLQSTGLDKAIGTASGTLTPFSNALGGFSGLGGGVAGGLMGSLLMRGGASRLGGLAGGLGGSGGGAGGAGLFTRLFGMFGGGGGAAAGGAGSTLTATAGANGVFSVGGLGGMGLGGMAGIGTAAAALFGSMFGAGKYASNAKNKKNHPLLSSIMGSWSGDPTLGGSMQPGTVGMLGTIAGSLGHLSGPLGRLMGYDGKSGGASGNTTSGKKSGSGGSASGSSTANAASIIKYAEQQLGDPYVWGGTGPNGWDCSGLIQWAYGQAGVKIPRTSQEQQKVGKAVATDAVQPGDLLFNGNPAHHVVMAIGGGKIIEAPRTGLNVRIRSFKPGEFGSARRIVGSVGNMSDISSDPNSSTTLNDQASTVGGNIGGAYGGTSELAALMSALGGGVGAGGAGISAQSGSSASTSDSSASTVSGSNPPGSPKGNQAIGKKLAQKYGWTGNQWKALYNLWMGESGWNEKADNPSSDAYGIPQALPGKKMASAGGDWKTNPETQIKWGLQYIKERYGSPAKAWSFWNSKNPHWYDEGAWSLDQDATARVHKGEMILPAKQAESVRNAITNTLTTGSNSTGGGGGVHFAAGAIVVQPQGPMTQQEAQMTGKMIVDAITEDKRIKEMQKGH